MNLEELQKYLDENNLTLEQYLRNNMITDEDRKYFDKIWDWVTLTHQITRQGLMVLMILLIGSNKINLMIGAREIDYGKTYT